jgi:hypothetical protein
MRTAGALAIAMLWLAGSGVARAQTASFPAALEREALLVWMQRETDILPSQVVAVTPQALTSVMSSFPNGAGSGPRLVIRAEALSSELQSRTGALSWHVSLNADCENRRIKLGETTGYSERNLLGERKVLRAAETGWRTPEPGTAVDHAWRAACEPGFAGPFKSSAVKLAQAESPRPSAVPEPGPQTPPQARAVAPVAAVAVARPAIPPVTLPASAKSAGVAAQLGAVGSDAAARALLVSLRGRLAGRTTWVERADVAGRTWHRALAGGFADAAEATRFCAGLKAAGQSCFVRSGG